MKKTDTFGVFTQSPFPTALLSSDAHILSRNEKALTISRKFRCRSNFACCLPEGMSRFLVTVRKADALMCSPSICPKREGSMPCLFPR